MLRYIHNGVHGMFVVSDEQVEVYRAEMLKTSPFEEVIIEEQSNIIVVADAHFEGLHGIHTEIALIICECEKHQSDEHFAMANGAILPGGIKDRDRAMRWFERSAREDINHPNHLEWLLDEMEYQATGSVAGLL